MKRIRAAVSPRKSPPASLKPASTSSRRRSGAFPRSTFRFRIARHWKIISDPEKIALSKQYVPSCIDRLKKQHASTASGHILLHVGSVTSVSACRVPQNRWNQNGNEEGES